MNDNVILVVDYEKICRLCLHSTGAMSDLFEDNGENTLKVLVHRATGLEIKQYDGFPTKICHRCRYIVELNCELRDMVLKTNKLLMNAGSHIKVDSINENIPVPQVQPQIKMNKLKKEKPDLRLIMQDDGVMALVKPDPGTPVDEKPNIVLWDKDALGMEIKAKSQIETVPSKLRRALPKNLTCQLCLSTFITEEDVNDHVKIHYVDSRLTPYLDLQKPYKCEMCNRSVSKIQLIKHHRSHLNINPYICKHAGCDYIGKNQDSLRHHVKKHLARSQVCEVCGAAYRRRFELRQHMTRAHLARATYCRECRKRFSNAITLSVHMSTHHRPRKHTCEWPGCTKAYHTQSSLSVHARSHKDEREFRCHLCSVAAYTSQSKLNRHIRMHDRARMSKCDKCSATFDDYGAFYEHRIAEHGQWQPYKCVGCDKRYRTEEKLDKHVQVCEKVTSSDNKIDCDDKTEQLLVTSIQEIIDSQDGQTETRDQFKGQSLLVQPGNTKRLVLQDLPADGLLYIEVDAEDDVKCAWKQ